MSGLPVAASASIRPPPDPGLPIQVSLASQASVAVMPGNFPGEKENPTSRIHHLVARIAFLETRFEKRVANMARHRRT
jgi:hypothetical protein